MSEPLDLDAIRERRAKAETWYEGVHYGLKLYAASSDDVPALLEEVKRQRSAVLAVAEDLERYAADMRPEKLPMSERKLAGVLRSIVEGNHGE